MVKAETDVLMEGSQSLLAEIITLLAILLAEKIHNANDGELRKTKKVC